MKKILQFLLTLIVLIFPSGVGAENDPKFDSLSLASTNAQLISVNVLVARVEEIRAMDMQAMTIEQRKELRKELISIKRELKEQKKTASQGVVKTVVWIVIGAVLGVILVLLFLLGAFS